MVWDEPGNVTCNFLQIPHVPRALSCLVEHSLPRINQLIEVFKGFYLFQNYFFYVASISGRSFNLFVVQISHIFIYCFMYYQMNDNNTLIITYPGMGNTVIKILLKRLTKEIVNSIT